MTNKKIAVSVAYVAMLVQLGTYIAHDTGRMNDGRCYQMIVLAASAVLLGAVIWIYRLGSSSRNSTGIK